MAARTPEFRARLHAWSAGNTVERVKNPLNPVRARALGYKAEKGCVVVRVRVKKGKRARPAPRMGRKPGKNVKRVPPGHSQKQIAEARAARKYSNLRVVNSYFVGQDGTSAFFEVIMHA